MFIFIYLARIVVSFLSFPHGHLVDDIENCLQGSLVPRVLCIPIVTNEVKLEILLPIPCVGMDVDQFPVVVVASSLGDLSLQPH